VGEGSVAVQFIHSVFEQGVKKWSENSELHSIPVFAGLPDDQISWFISQSQELSLQGWPNLTFARVGPPRMRCS